MKCVKSRSSNNSFISPDAGNALFTCLNGESVYSLSEIDSVLRLDGSFWTFSELPVPGSELRFASPTVAPSS